MHVGLTVEIAQPGSVSAAQAAYAAASAATQGFIVTTLTGFADGGFIARKSQGGNTVASIDVLAGSTFFLIEFTGAGSGPSDGAFKTGATLVLGSLP